MRKKICGNPTIRAESIKKSSIPPVIISIRAESAKKTSIPPGFFWRIYKVYLLNKKF